MIEVVSVILYREGRICVAIRPEGKEYAGFVETPGGKREDHELSGEAAVRELREETDLDLHYARFMNAGYAACINTRGQQFGVTTFVVFLTKDEQPRKPEGGSGWSFILPADLASGRYGRLVPGLIPFLEAIFCLKCETLT